MPGVTRSFAWLGIMGVTLALTLFFALHISSSAAPARPGDGPAIAPDFAFDVRVMRGSDFDPANAAASCAAATSSLSVTPGVTLTYCYLFSNIGSTIFITHTLVDDKLGTTGPVEHPVPPGGSWGFAAWENVPPAAADVTNTATWTAIDDFSTTVARQDAATVRVLTPRLRLPAVFR